MKAMLIRQEQRAITKVNRGKDAHRKDAMHKAKAGRATLVDRDHFLSRAAAQGQAAWGGGLIGGRTSNPLDMNYRPSMLGD